MLKQIFSLSQLKKKYRNQWVLTQVLKEDELNQPIKVRMITHSKNRDDIYAALKKTRAKYTYYFYTGKIPPKGYAFAF